MYEMFENVGEPAVSSSYTVLIPGEQSRFLTMDD